MYQTSRKRREIRCAYTLLIRKRGRKRQFGRLRRSRDDDIFIDVREIKYEGVYLIEQAQDRVKSCAFIMTVINLWVP
jgi:hypothetical protein